MLPLAGSPDGCGLIRPSAFRPRNALAPWAVSPPQLAAEIRHAAWMVRHYRRSAQRVQRAAAIRELGLVVRKVFNQSEDFEHLLNAIVEGLKPQDYEPPF